MSAACLRSSHVVTSPNARCALQDTTSACWCFCIARMRSPIEFTISNYRFADGHDAAGITQSAPRSPIAARAARCTSPCSARRACCCQCTHRAACRFRHHQPAEQRHIHCWKRLTPCIYAHRTFNGEQHMATLHQCARAMKQFAAAPQQTEDATFRHWARTGGLSLYSSSRSGKVAGTPHCMSSSWHAHTLMLGL